MKKKQLDTDQMVNDLSTSAFFQQPTSPQVDKPTNPQVDKPTNPQTHKSTSGFFLTGVPWQWHTEQN
jgi:hypothetical protein